jgi:hypothetical protein
MAGYNTSNHAKWARWGFFLGATLLALGASGEIVGHLLFESLPDWENTLFVYAEGLGITIGFFAPLIFGIVLPLAES